MSVEHFALPYTLYDDGSVYNHQGQPVLVRHYETGFSMQVVQYSQQSAVVIPNAVHDADSDESDDESEEADDSDAQTSDESNESEDSNDGNDSDDHLESGAINANDSDDSDEFEDIEQANVADDSDDSVKPGDILQNPIDLTAESDDDEVASTGTQNESLDLAGDGEVEDEQDDSVVPDGFRRRLGGKRTWPGCIVHFDPEWIIEPVTDDEDEDVHQVPGLEGQCHFRLMRLKKNMPTSPADVIPTPSTSNDAPAQIPKSTPSIQTPKVTKKRSHADLEEDSDGNDADVDDADDEDYEYDSQPSPAKRAKVLKKSSGSVTKRANPKKNQSNSSGSGSNQSNPSGSGSNQSNPSGSGPTPPRWVTSRFGPKPPPDPKRRNAPWVRAEKDAIESIIRQRRQTESQQDLKPIYDKGLYDYCSDEMWYEFGHNRSGVACKNYWCRIGRAESGFDERSNAERISRPLTTSAQVSKKASSSKASSSKASSSKASSSKASSSKASSSKAASSKNKKTDEDDDDDVVATGDGFSGGFGGGRTMNLGGFPPEMLEDAYED